MVASRSFFWQGLCSEFLKAVEKRINASLDAMRREFSGRDLPD
jgi:hypothetical protein